MKERVGAFSLLLLLPLAPLLAAGCPLEKATYVLRSSGHDWLRVGSDPNGEMIFRFTLGKREKSIALPQVIDRIRIERLGRQREPVDPRSDEAPAFIGIEGLARIAGVPDGEWRLAWCTQH
jgi:hypothetical protein